MFSVAAALIGLFACSSFEDVASGTIVGNPGDGMVGVAAGEGLSYTSATADIDGITLVSCSGAEGREPFGARLDLLDGGSLPLLEGAWCQLRLDVSALQIAGDGPDGSSFTLDLAPGEVALDSDGFIVVGDTYVLELAYPDWVTADALGLEADVHVEVGEDDALFEDLNAAVADGSGLFFDLDDDGAVSELEREEQQLAAGDARGLAGDTGAASGDAGFTGDTGDDQVLLQPGCGGGGQGWFLLLAPLLLRRRSGKIVHLSANS